MGWEKRRNGLHYYSARRAGGRDVKRNLGPGPVAAVTDLGAP